MKRILVIIVWLVGTTSLSAQNFSGEIIKQTTIMAKQEGLDTDSILNAKLGDTSVYLITDGYYKSVYQKNGKMTYGYTYRKGENKMFDEDAELPYITYRDARKSSGPMADWQVFADSTITVLGYECFLVKQEYETHTSYSYYTNELKVRYDNFEGHQVADWYNRLKDLDGAQLLKVVSEYPEYTEISEATRVDVRAVEISEFDLPINKPVFASYQALDENVGMGEVTQELATCYNSKVTEASNTDSPTTKYTVYIRVVVSENGSLNLAKATEEDEHGFYKVALDIVENCGLQLTPGKIDGKAVSSETFFPIEFTL